MFNSKTFIIGTAATAAIASAASADFLGFDGNVETIGDYTVIQMHAVFSNDTDVALNLFEAVITTGDNGGFNHSDVQSGAGGTWAPTASLDIPGFADSSIDSYANMGYGVANDAATNGTALDPTWLDATNGLGASVPVGAGWYNGNPGNDVNGTVYGGGVDGISGYGVMVGQFVFETARMTTEDFFVFDSQIGFANPEVAFGADLFTYGIPAPGALALLGLGAVASRRRRS
ncbi:MAG: hypothetical protein VX641_06030 [Planctomycetota bacterium]|nr:hypothetical protein [Planctomycetota bacterium]